MPAAVVADANVVLSALIGGRARLVIASAHPPRCVAAEAVAIEIARHVPRLATKRRLDPALLFAALQVVPIEWRPDTDYDGRREDAEKRIAARDPDGWPTVALALTLSLPVWSQDKDLATAGLDVYTTGNLLDALREAGHIEIADRRARPVALAPRHRHFAFGLRPQASRRQRAARTPIATAAGTAIASGKTRMSFGWEVKPTAVHSTRASPHSDAFRQFEYDTSARAPTPFPHFSAPISPPTPRPARRSRARVPRVQPRAPASGAHPRTTAHSVMPARR